jgi:hypothetical protein
LRHIWRNSPQGDLADNMATGCGLEVIQCPGGVTDLRWMENIGD